MTGFKEQKSTWPPFFFFSWGSLLFQLKKMRAVAPVRNADIATDAAAKLIWGNVARQIGMPNMSASAMSTSIRPVYWVVWNRAIIDIGDTKRIIDLLPRIRNSSLPTHEYRRLVAIFRGAYRSANSPPSDLRSWRQTAERFSLYSTFGWGPILEMCASLHTKFMWLPVGMGAFFRNSFMCYSEDSLAAAFTDLWSITRSMGSYQRITSLLTMRPLHRNG